MATLYIRDVPADVAEKLKQRAADAGMSLSAYVARQLTALTSDRPNAAVVEKLRRLDRSGFPSTEEIVNEIHAAREERDESFRRIFGD